jgi:hypothetical protein
MNFASRYTQQKSKGDVLDAKQKIRIHGKEIWNVLHTFSNFVPENPTREESEAYSAFIEGVLVFGTKFDQNWHNLTLQYITANPLDVTSRDTSMMWVCNFHNFVNVKLEKDLFECTKENLAKRWGNKASISGDNKNHVTI